MESRSHLQWARKREGKTKKDSGSFTNHIRDTSALYCYNHPTLQDPRVPRHTYFHVGTHSHAPLPSIFPFAFPLQRLGDHGHFVFMHKASNPNPTLLNHPSQIHAPIFKTHPGSSPGPFGMPTPRPHLYLHRCEWPVKLPEGRELGFRVLGFVLGW